ncbi:hypothetical protein B296_00018760, partial [Ensete ventricosum]
AAYVVQLLQQHRGVLQRRVRRPTFRHHIARCRPIRRPNTSMSARRIAILLIAGHRPRSETTTPATSHRRAHSCCPSISTASRLPTMTSLPWLSTCDASISCRRAEKTKKGNIIREFM